MGTWGTLCASRWDLSDAHVLCRHLGCGFAETVPKGGHFGRGTGPVWSDSFHCDGSEAHLDQCPVAVLGASLCSHENDAAVICSGACRKKAVVTPSAPLCNTAIQSWGCHSSTRLQLSLEKPYGVPGALVHFWRISALCRPCSSHVPAAGGRREPV